MAEYADSDDSTGFLRAFGRMRRPRKATGVDDASMLKVVAVGHEPTRNMSPRDVARAQSRLRDQAAEQQDVLELWPLPGLAPMTRVRTSFGDVHAVALRKGDAVLLRSGEYKPIQWIDRIMLDEHILKLKQDSNPIQFARGSLGKGMPAHDMMVSPRQLFCADERAGLAKPREASMLVSRAGVRRYRETGLTYTMFHVGETADIYCEGVFLRFPVEP